VKAYKVYVKLSGKMREIFMLILWLAAVEAGACLTN
jgi:hypothetical protein